MIKAIVVGVGGFLNIGERNVAIAPSSIVLTETADGSAHLVVNTTREDLKNAPSFDFSDVDKAGAGVAPAASAALPSENKGASTGASEGTSGSSGQTPSGTSDRTPGP